MARKKVTDTPVHEQVQSYTEKITALASRRGALEERVRLNAWLQKQIDIAQDPAELNLLKAMSEVINNA
jgi:hypothetical protein